MEQKNPCPVCLGVGKKPKVRHGQTVFEVNEARDCRACNGTGISYGPTTIQSSSPFKRWLDIWFPM